MGRPFLVCLFFYYFCRSVVIENIKNNPFVTSKELSDIIGITSDNILVNISKLKNKGIIRREGADKGGKWIIIKNR